MAAFIPTAGAVRTDITFNIGGQEAHNILWFKREANWTQSEREALNDAIAAWWNTTAKLYFGADIALVQVQSVNQENQNAPASTLVVSPAVFGTGGSPTLPSNLACCATLRTDLRGRNYRGRMYLAGAPSAAVTQNNKFLTTNIGYWITALTALKTAVEALGAIWVVVSHYLNKAPRAQGTSTPITAISIDQGVDNQRRRAFGRGV